MPVTKGPPPKRAETQLLNTRGVSGLGGAVVVVVVTCVVVVVFSVPLVVPPQDAVRQADRISRKTVMSLAIFFIVIAFSVI